MSLYIVKRMGGGTIYLGTRYFEESLDDLMRDLAPLVSLQPYVAEVRPLEPGVRIDIDLDKVKQDRFLYDSPLLHVMSRAQGLPLEREIGAWLEVPDLPGFEDKIVIHRRLDPRGRPPNKSFQWGPLIELFGRDRVVFASRLRAEWEQFNREHRVEWLCPKDNLEHARAIRSCRLFIGSQSFPSALADALDKDRIIELAPALYSRNFMNDYSPRCWYHLNDWKTKLRGWRWGVLSADTGFDLLEQRRGQLPKPSWTARSFLSSVQVEGAVRKSQVVEYLRHWLISND